MPARLVDCSWFLLLIVWSWICWWMLLVLVSSSFVLFVLAVVVVLVGASCPVVIIWMSCSWSGFRAASAPSGAIGAPGFASTGTGLSP